MFEIFKIDFLKFTFLDLLDIGIVALIIYKLYNYLRGTIASQIFVGLIIVFILSFTAQAVNLKAISWLLKFITDIWIIAFIILFQPEIRRLLVILAKSPLFKLNFKVESPENAQIITDAAVELAQHQHGALIVVIKSSGIRGFSETGDIIEAKLNKDLLRNIFYPRSPLHDGAVIIKDDVIEAVRCTLPISVTKVVDGETLGLRHRAGLGISEQADVVSIIVSEETGSISIAENGVLTKGVTREALKKRLTKTGRISKYSVWKRLIENFFQKK